MSVGNDVKPVSVAHGEQSSDPIDAVIALVPVPTADALPCCVIVATPG